MTNPFVEAETWEVSTGTFLPAGDHVCEIMEIDGSTNSSGGHPQIELKVGNDLGEIRDWIVVIPATVGKVTQLTDACGLDRPTESQFAPEGTGYRLDAKYLGQLQGMKVGVIVRSEPDRMDPTKLRDRVKGYVPEDKIDPRSDVTPSAHDTVVQGPNGPMTFPGATSKDDDIPFAPCVI